MAMSYNKTFGLARGLNNLGLRTHLAQSTFRPVAFRRGIQIQSLPPSSSQAILNKQRLRRPSSPHFTIYQPQLTWVSSIANRFSGVGLSVLMYSYFLAYLAAPGTFDSAHVLEVISGLPEVVKYSAKAILAAPFAFHTLNGIRHLGWDVGKFLTLKGSYQAGYAVLAATAVTTVGLVLL